VTTETQQTVGQWLEDLAGKDESTERDSTKMQNLLHRCGFPAAVCVLGIVYLEGHGTLRAPPMSINGMAKTLLDMMRPV